MEMSRPYSEFHACKVLITGAGDGLGRAMAVAYARHLAQIAIIDIDEDGAHETARLVREAGAQAVVQRASVTDEMEYLKAMAVLDADWGTPDVVIANAGIAMNKPSLDLSMDEFRRACDINLGGVFLTAREAGRRMIPRGRGNIQLMSSMYGITAAPERVAYTSTKAAVTMMAKSLACEWAPKGLRVNAIGPGYVRTALVDRLVANGRLNEQAIKQRTPQGRFCTTNEIAEASLFLASDRSSFVNGQQLTVDGGWSSYGYI